MIAPGVVIGDDTPGMGLLMVGIVWMGIRYIKSVCK
jgi:hypothetical protein